MLNSVCVYDLSGSAVDLARILSKTVSKVFYYKGWKQGGFPLPNIHLVGTGIPNVIRVDDFEKWKKTEKCDLIIFTDIYEGSLQKELQSQGYSVFGCREYDRFEIYRDESRKLLQKLELPVNPEYVEMRGITELREFLKTHKDQYVKINKHRGLAETFHSKDYEIIDLVLDDLQYKLGSAKEQKLFMVEGKLPSEMVEAGMDIYTADGRVADIVMCGLEIKDKLYYGVVKPYKDYPECLKLVIDKLLPVFGEYGYRGAYSYEAKMGKDLKPIVIDQSCRFGNPPGSLQWYMYRENLAEMLKAIADGVPASPTGSKRVGLEIMIESEFCTENSMAIRIPKEIRDHVFLMNYRMVDGKDDLYYIVPQPEKISEIGSVVVEGDSLEDCKRQIKEICDQIEAFEISFSLEAMDNLDKEIEKLDEFGINFYKDEIHKEPEEKKVEEPKVEEPVIAIEPKKELPPKVRKFLQTINK